MSTPDRDTTMKEIAELRDRIAQLESQLGPSTTHWEAQEYYTAYHATSGFMLGAIGAAASLLFNVVGSSIVGQHPLQLIKVYLTFPLGAKALEESFGSGIALAVGCCLYLGTGMLLGVPFQMVMARVLPKGTLWQRLGLATVLGLLLFALNFYLIISWLQPLLIGGNWIVDPNILPPWVGAATHLVFAWTMALIYPWGAYEPYRRQTEQAQTPAAAG